MATTQHTIVPIGDEIWKPVVGYEGLYEVSSHGRVRSLDRLSSHYRAAYQYKKGRMLKPRLKQARKFGRYLQVALFGKDGRKDHPIYTLVLEAFIGPRPPRFVCNHIDGNPENNTVGNLEWVSYQRNAQHAVESGRMINYCGEQHGLARFTNAQVLEIRRLAASGITCGAIGKVFQAPWITIRRIVNREVWKHLPEEPGYENE